MLMPCQSVLDVPACSISMAITQLCIVPAGNHDDYWRVLWDTGKLTKEKMAAFSKPISGEKPSHEES